jgi:hypothetical protein
MKNPRPKIIIREKIVRVPYRAAAAPEARRSGGGLAFRILMAVAMLMVIRAVGGLLLPAHPAPKADSDLAIAKQLFPDALDPAAAKLIRAKKDKAQQEEFARRRAERLANQKPAASPTPVPPPSLDSRGYEELARRLSDQQAVIEERTRRAKARSVVNAEEMIEQESRAVPPASDRLKLKRLLEESSGDVY